MNTAILPMGDLVIIIKVLGQLISEPIIYRKLLSEVTPLINYDPDVTPVIHQEILPIPCPDSR